MVLALDVNAKQYTEFMSSIFPGDLYQQRLRGLDADLNRVMEDNGMDDLLQLFHEVAVR